VHDIGRVRTCGQDPEGQQNHPLNQKKVNTKYMNRDYPLAESPNMQDRKTIRAAKGVAKAKAKLDFKKEILVAKENEANMPKYMVRDNIKDERKNYKEAKKEIRKYKDY
jgi:hypothetical protein